MRFLSWSRITPYHIGVAVAVPVLLWLSATTLGSTGLGRIAALERTLAAEQIKVDALQERNQLFAAEVVLLKSDEGQVEVLARHHFGMIKPGEIFIQISAPSQ